MSQAIPVRELLTVKPLELKRMLNGNYPIMFEDNTVFILKDSEMTINRYIWELLMPYPNVVITKEFNIVNFYSNGMFNGKTVNKCFSFILSQIVETWLIPNNLLSFKELEFIHANVFKIINDIYSELSYEVAEYHISIDILDAIELQSDERLLTAIEYVKEAPIKKSIDKAYDVLHTVMCDVEKYKYNPLRQAYISGMINPNQVKQVLGPRGFVTEIDSSIFRKPLYMSFTMGLQDLYSLLTESRSAAKALQQSHDAIKLTESFGRELQLVTMVVEKIVIGDCGNNEYIDWYVLPKDNKYKGDLSNMVGMPYLDTDGILKNITGNETHLENTTIKMRSVLKCKHENRKHVCSTCYGKTFVGIPEHSNIGHYASAKTNGDISQGVLSTKHLTASATTDDLVLDDITKQFFKVKDDGYALNISNSTRKKYYVNLLISQSACFGLKDVENVQLDQINPLKVSSVDLATIELIDKKTKKKEYYPITIKHGNRVGVLQPKFIAYVIEKGLVLSTNKDHYTFNLNDWVLITPLLKLPNVEYSFFALAKDVKKLLNSRSILKNGKPKETPEMLLSILYSKINAKLNVNIALLQIIVYSLTTYDMVNGNYDLGRGSPEQMVTDIPTAINKRSLGAGYDYGFLTKRLLNWTSFVKENKTSHPMDAMVQAIEVIENTKGKL